MAAKPGKDYEFAVDDASGREHVFKDLNEASAFAIQVALATGKADLDMLAYSEDGAEFLLGEEGIESYLEDPEASVLRRYEIKVNDMGRVP